MLDHVVADGQQPAPLVEQETILHVCQLASLAGQVFDHRQSGDGKGVARLGQVAQRGQCIGRRVAGEAIQFGQCLADLPGQRLRPIVGFAGRQAWGAGSEAGGDLDEQIGRAVGQLLQRQMGGGDGGRRRRGGRIE